MTGIPEHWKYTGFRTDYSLHCDRCNKVTNLLHWYQMNAQQSATLCEECEEKYGHGHKSNIPDISSKPVDWTNRHTIDCEKFGGLIYPPSPYHHLDKKTKKWVLDKE
jgi:hypothetical protein